MPTMYFVHNTSRSRHNRTDRAKLPQRARMKQHIGTDQTRCVRGRPVAMTEETLNRNLDDLKARAALHVIEVRTADGRRLNLDTMELDPIAPATKLREPMLDSVANDKNFAFPPGYKFIPSQGEDPNAIPDVLAEGQKPTLLAEELAREAAQQVDAPPAAPVVADETQLDAAVAAAQNESAEDDAVPSDGELPADGEDADEAEAPEGTDPTAPPGPGVVSSEGRRRGKGKKNR